MRASAIIVAAGSGTRLGFNRPKAFVELCGQPMLAYSLRTIAQVAGVEEAVITVPPGMQSRARALIKEIGLEIPVKLTPGGAERQDSVRIALELTSSEAEMVIVHDAARPFATPAIFEAALAAAERCGGAIAAIPVADTLKRVGENPPDPAANARPIIETVARAHLWQAQTPQAYRRAILLQAHRQAVIDRIVGTDDSKLLEDLGVRVEIVDGSGLNFKITTAEDLYLAELVAAAAPGRPY
jgi:2-C-methyl-D-erythritol 4-phosphate cytidylyltransferase